MHVRDILVVRTNNFVENLQQMYVHILYTTLYDKMDKTFHRKNEIVEGKKSNYRLSDYIEYFYCK